MPAPRPEDVISGAIDARLERVYTQEPGIITAFDPDKLTCSVQPSMMQRYVREDGQIADVPKPVLMGVRVLYPGQMRWRLSVGDPVMIEFCSTAIVNWNPATKKPQVVGDDRRHALSDAVVHPSFPVNVKEKPAANEVILSWRKVKLGDPGTPVQSPRSPVVREVDLEAGLAIAQAALTAATGNPALVAALTPLVNSIQAMIDNISGNVEAT